MYEHLHTPIPTWLVVVPTDHRGTSPHRSWPLTEPHSSQAAKSPSQSAKQQLSISAQHPCFRLRAAPAAGQLLNNYQWYPASQAPVLILQKPCRESRWGRCSESWWKQWKHQAERCWVVLHLRINQGTSLKCIIEHLSPTASNLYNWHHTINCIGWHQVTSQLHWMTSTDITPITNILLLSKHNKWNTLPVTTSTKDSWYITSL